MHVGLKDIKKGQPYGDLFISFDRMYGRNRVYLQFDAMLQVYDDLKLPLSRATQNRSAASLNRYRATTTS